MIHRIDESIPINELPTWLQELWELDSTLARRAEKHYLELIQVKKSSVMELIEYIENDAEIGIPIDQLFNEDGSSVSKKKYGLVLLKYLVKELKQKFILE